MTHPPTIRDTERLRQLTEQGVAIWLDDLSRDRLDSGTLRRLVEECYVVGVTSNPTIFQTAITKSSAYDDQLRMHAELGSDAGDRHPRHDDRRRPRSLRPARAGCRADRRAGRPGLARGRPSVGTRDPGDD